TILLVTFSLASIICSLSIYNQFQKIYSVKTETSRTPASLEIDEFDRPQYYKEVYRQIKISGVRIPVYYPKVNELQTVTIDFSVTLNNRIGRVFIENREYYVRDHLIR